MLTKLISFDIKIPIQAINFYRPLDSCRCALYKHSLMGAFKVTHRNLSWADLMAAVGALLLQLALKFFTALVKMSVI